MRTAPQRVSVIISTLNRAPSLDRTLRSLRYLRYPRFEVIVVRGPCSDGTDAVLARFRDCVRVGRCSEANLAVSRNVGLSLAQGEIVAFLDDDAIPEPDWLDRLVEGFSEPRIAAVGGFIRDKGGIRYQYQYTFANRFGDARSVAKPDRAGTGPDEYPSPTGTNVALRREAVVSIGGFDEEYAYFLDETDINLRLHDRGWTLVFSPEAEIHHKYLESSLRKDDATPLSLYVIARSKAYFTGVHARGRYPDSQLAARISTYRERQRRRLRSLVRAGRISASVSARLLEEVDRGIEDGRYAAQSAGSSRPSRTSSTQIGQAAGFREFALARRPEDRMRLCFLLGADHASGSNPESERLHEVAAAIAGRGHEVTVIQSTPGENASIDFVDNLWIHRIGDHWLSKLVSFAKPQRRSQALMREVARIQARRQFQLIWTGSTDGGEIARFRRVPAPMLVRGPAKSSSIEAIETELSDLVGAKSPPTYHDLTSVWASSG